MGKQGDIKELINMLAIALRHRIGSLVNSNEIYAQKYSKDADSFIKEAEKIAVKHNWNNYDKSIIRKQLMKKLKDELKKREFLDNKKFDIMEDEIDKALDNI